IGMGCVNVTPCSVTPDSAARGTLAVFFDQSADPSGRYCNVDGGCNTQGNPAANLGYLQVYSSDLNYVLNHPSDPLSATLQQANQDILAFAQGG
ncbi:MAG TPA: hypothetical protein VFZ25_19625, partial [Chloroflexota bacterium]|nr:hypothetical protein [Chloroflexota bacterium]